ncbi:ModE family transcriptional regulator [Sphingobium sp. AN641]|uniref:winged helix-turn-helix domain-containing protein n=1 Tax=Sphingobium sp. AN641 TaxID=3133443 RepID=UPI0030BE849F
MRVGPLKIKLQLLCGDGFAMGPGKADLLEAIDMEQSISGAGRALGMSYRRTWLLVDEMNRCFQDKLVETLAGGGRERGARVTPFGHRVLAAYRAAEVEAARVGDSAAYAELIGMLLDEPRADKPQKPET